MHPNPSFRAPDRARDFVAGRGFGMLTINADAGPLAAHIPFLLDGETAHLHLVRSNPIARALTTPQKALIAVSGPDGYVSPDWYDGATDQVPTWNYVAVHLRGTLHLRPQEDMRALLDAQSADFERRLAPKPPWTADKMTPDALTRMMRQIVPLRFEIDSWAETFKLSQNKPDTVRHAAAAQMRDHGIGIETTALSEMMDALPDG